ncbi:SDR family NAD(P)-dependent oxidoreductase [Nonomuraea polychroma]|uniref:SDR family NAD(P)-dependent oxidoreductase n=1 Tax=Nonomuraea polychroma TaxID=46176 RepID=UPI0019D4E1B1|nr:SDR family NAD(P)-dependent oxidoreductase [Nonomuraea polychroma]
MSRIAVVTGANQGLGYALVEGLAQRLGPEDIVYLTGRDRDRIQQAASRLDTTVARIRTHTLDVRDEDSVTGFAQELSGSHGGVDIVFSNAAARLTPDTPWSELVGPLVETNNLGTTRMLRAFAPILRPGGRLLVVASDFGTLRSLPAGLHERFGTDAMTLADVDTVMTAWRDAVLNRTAEQEGVARLDQHPVQGRPGRRRPGPGSRAARGGRGRRYAAGRRLSWPGGHGRLASMVRQHERGPEPRRGRGRPARSCPPAGQAGDVRRACPVRSCPPMEMTMIRTSQLAESVPHDRPSIWRAAGTRIWAGLRIDLAKVPEERVQELVERAWRHKTPKRVVAGYDAG